MAPRRSKEESEQMKKICISLNEKINALQQFADLVDEHLCPLKSKSLL
jgi:hypothetical protein